MSETATIKHDQGTYEGTLASIRQMVARDFSNHVLEVTGPQEYWCHRPGTGTNSFRVIVRPGMVCIYGDLGEAIFRGGEGSGNQGGTLGWLKRAVRSPHYLDEKLQPGREQFYPNDALTWARTYAEENGGLWRDLHQCAADLHADGGLDAHAWAELVYEYGGDSETGRIGQNTHRRTLILIEALRWLTEHLPAEALKAEASR